MKDRPPISGSRAEEIAGVRPILQRVVANAGMLLGGRTVNGAGVMFALNCLAMTVLFYPALLASWIWIW